MTLLRWLAALSGGHTWPNGVRALLGGVMYVKSTVCRVAKPASSVQEPQPGV